MLKFHDYDEGDEYVLALTPADYPDPETAAKALHKELRELSLKYGRKPDIEVSLWSPEEAAKRDYGACWMVSWEAGPTGWGIMFSEVYHNMPGGWFTEPHYSFDVTFVDERIQKAPVEGVAPPDDTVPYRAPETPPAAKDILVALDEWQLSKLLVWASSNAATYESHYRTDGLISQAEVDTMNKWRELARVLNPDAHEPTEPLPFPREELEE